MSDDATLRAKQSIRSALVLAGAMLGGTLLLALANKLGWINSDLTTRGVMVLIGLMLVIIGNAMPKKLEGPVPPSVGVAALRQAISRVGGWAMTLGGVAYAGLWAFAPRDVALIGSVSAVLLAVAVMFGYALWRIAASRSSLP
jgi:hypothetical protein